MPAQPPAADATGAPFQEIHDLYDKADCFVREVTEFGDEVMIPPMNELRYGGHHALQAMVAATEEKRTEHLGKAHGHCERAMYDASEIGIMDAIREITDLRAAYPGVVISSVVADYTDIVAMARRAQKMIIAGRSKRKSAPAQAAAYMDAFRELREAYERLDAGRDDLNALEARSVSERRRFIITLVTRTVLGIAAIVIALLALP